MPGKWEKEVAERKMVKRKNKGAIARDDWRAVQGVGTRKSKSAKRETAMKKRFVASREN